MFSKWIHILQKQPQIDMPGFKPLVNKPLDATPLVFAHKDRGWETRQDMKPHVLFLISVVIQKKTSLGKKCCIQSIPGQLYVNL